MHIVFLGANLPLTKTIACRDNQFAVAPYPYVSKLTSYHETATTLPEFRDHLLTHADQQHCLFNGQLQHPLINESRSGKTLKAAPREWVVFDFDRVDAKTHEEAIAKYLPPECQDISYIVQVSASMFRPDAVRFSGHVFMMLKEPSNEAQLRQYVEQTNFALPALKANLTLTDSCMGLHWPLDRSAAYDSKLIYIAPPRCHGFKPAIAADNAITLVKKRHQQLKIPLFVPLSRQQIEAEINVLRQKAGMTAHDFHTRPFEDGEVLVGAERGVIAGVKAMGDHYIKLNLNGGDSLGYWIDLRNPAVIKNFKGEPWLLTKEVDPDFYKSLAKAAPHVIAKPALEEGAEVLAFYATNQNSSIKVGLYSALDQRLTLNTANETSARAWLAEFGLTQKGYLPHMDLVFDPKSDLQFIPGATHVNTFRATPYMTRARSSAKDSTLSEIPSVTNKTLFSVLGNPTIEVYSRFINWLAFIFQFREKAGTAWVMSGRTGTGKGTFIKYILSPLFGHDAVNIVQFGSVTSTFNSFLEHALFVVFEEADTRSVPNQNELMSKLRHWITDSPLPIRRTFTDVYNAENYTNFLFMANTRNSVVVPHDDRRFNFAERQEQKIVYTPNEILTLQAGTELDVFADVLQRWPVDKLAVMQIVQTQAQADVHEATTSVNQLVAEAIINGDLQFFLDRTPSDAEAASDFYNRVNLIGLFRTQIDKYITAATTGESLILKDEDLFTLFRTLIPDPRYFQDSKTWRRRHYKMLGLNVDKGNRTPGAWDRITRGVLVRWQLPEGAKALGLVDKVVDIKKSTRRKIK